jgi:outer membrane immunogenic protein
MPGLREGKYIMLRHGIAACALTLFAQPAFAGSGEAGTNGNGWTGVYGGVEIGVVRSRPRIIFTQSMNQGIGAATTLTITSSGVVPNARSTDAFYGGRIGWQGQSGHFVYGLEADAHAGGISNDSVVAFGTGVHVASPSGTETQSRHLRESFGGSLRARVGFAFGGTLIYAAGGVANARVRLRSLNSYSYTTTANPAVTNTVANSGSESRNFTGWTAGGGIEQHLSPTFSIGLDLRYDHLGSADYGPARQTTTRTDNVNTAFTASPVGGTVRLTDARASLRLAYHF